MQTLKNKRALELTAGLAETVDSDIEVQLFEMEEDLADRESSPGDFRRYNDSMDIISIGSDSDEEEDMKAKETRGDCSQDPIDLTGDSTGEEEEDEEEDEEREGGEEDEEEEEESDLGMDSSFD